MLFGLPLGYLLGTAANNSPAEECFNMPQREAPPGYKIDFSWMRDSEGISPWSFVKAQHGTLVRIEDWDDDKHITLEDLQAQDRQQKHS